MIVYWPKILLRIYWDFSKKHTLDSRFQSLSELTHITANNSDYSNIHLLSLSISSLFVEIFFPNDRLQQLENISQLIEQTYRLDFNNNRSQNYDIYGNTIKAQTSSFLPLLLLKWNTSDLTHWISEEKTATKLIGMVTKLIGRIQAKTKLLLSVRINTSSTTKSPKKKITKLQQEEQLQQLLEEQLLETNLYEEEMKLLFAAQSQLISITISNSSEPR